MRRRDKGERKELRAVRAASGRRSAQLSGATLALVAELLNATRGQVYGLDELVYELASAELERRAAAPVAPAVRKLERAS